MTTDLQQIRPLKNTNVFIAVESDPVSGVGLILASSATFGEWLYDNTTGAIKVKKSPNFIIFAQKITSSNETPRLILLDAEPNDESKWNFKSGIFSLMSNDKIIIAANSSADGGSPLFSAMNDSGVKLSTKFKVTGTDPAPPTPPGPTPPGPTQVIVFPDNGNLTPLYEQWWFWLIIIVLIILFFVGLWLILK